MQPLADARWMHDDRCATPFLLPALLPPSSEIVSLSCIAFAFLLVACKVVHGAG